MAELLLSLFLLLLLAPPAVQPSGVLELRVLSARGGSCGGRVSPPPCLLLFRLCLRPPGGVGCSLGVAHSPPGPPPTPGSPRILRLPFAFPWPGIVSIVIESWRLEETKDPRGPQVSFLGRWLSRQRLRPGGPWRGGAARGGLRFGTRLRCHPPARAPFCTLPPPARCPPQGCSQRTPPRRCRPQRGTEGGTCAEGSTCVGQGCATPSLAQPPVRPEALAVVPPAAVVALPAPVVALPAEEAARVAPPPSPVPPPALPEPVPEVPPSPCALGPCFNGGACAPAPPLASAPGTGYSCRCPPGFRGANCERRADRCSQHLCLNGGQCQDLGPSGASCRCPPGFSGRRCQRNADDCSPNPCANGGTCQDGANSFTCSCTLGYAGHRCQHRADACASSPCQHGATCYTHISGHVCACPPGYMGVRCQEAVEALPSRIPQRQTPAPLALACALPLGLVAPGVGLALVAQRRRRRRMEGEGSGAEAEVGGGETGSSPPRREQRPSGPSATRV